jgi:hypothetical protein
MLVLWPAVMEASGDSEDFSEIQNAGLRRL